MNFLAFPFAFARSESLQSSRGLHPNAQLEAFWLILDHFTKEIMIKSNIFIRRELFANIYIILLGDGKLC